MTNSPPRNTSHMNETSNITAWALESEQFRNVVYPIIIPVFVVIATCGVASNALIVIASRRIPKKLSVNLRLCLSLAVADCAACTFRIFNMFINYYGPGLLSYKSDGEAATCMNLGLQVFFYGACVTSILHLGTIALNHLAGTKVPLKYTRYVTRHRCNLVIVGLWILPTLLLIVFIAATEKSKEGVCTIANQRIVPMIFATLSTALLAGVAGVYVYIFRKHALSEAETDLMRKHVDPAQAAESRRKVIGVTLLITVTFAIGWLPAFYWDALITWETMQSWIVASMSAMAFNTITVLLALLQLLKLIINPFIYTLRMPEIKKAVGDVFSCCHRRSTNQRESKSSFISRLSSRWNSYQASRMSTISVA